MLTRLEGAPIGASLPLSEVLADLPFDQQGLVAAIAQQFDTREVLMLAWMNRAAILLLVDQVGGACHTGRRSCFFNAVKGDRVEVISALIQIPIHKNQK